MELLGTGSLSLYHCFVKSMLILAVIITEQLNGLGNFQFRRIPENISLRFDLDWNQIWKAPSNFHWTTNLAFEPDLTGNLKLDKLWIGPYIELMWIEAVSLKIIWSSVLEINCHVQLRAFPGLRLFSSLSHPKNEKIPVNLEIAESCSSNKPPPLGHNVWGASASNFHSYTGHCSGACCKGSLQVAWKKSGMGMENSRQMQWGTTGLEQHMKTS